MNQFNPSVRLTSRPPAHTIIKYHNDKTTVRPAGVHLPVGLRLQVRARDHGLHSRPGNAYEYYQPFSYILPML